MSEDALSTAFKERLTQMIHKGITTVEVKGGYGLSTESELRVHRLIKTHGLPISTVGTFLAHTIPGEWQIDAQRSSTTSFTNNFLPVENGLSPPMYTVTEGHLHSMSLSPFYPLQKVWG